MNTIILVVEDEPFISKSIREALEEGGYYVRTAPSAEDAVLELQKSQPHLILLDIRLPEMNGLDFCRKIRDTPIWKALPIIFLTSKEEEVDKVLGLELGGDDYIAKPFRAPELLARVKAVLRRYQPAETDEVLKGGALTVEVDKRLAKISRKTLAMTAKEFELLCLLLRKKGRVLSRPFIMEALWGREYDTASRTIDTHIHNLRKTLGTHGACIKSVEKMGYKWEDL